MKDQSLIERWQRAYTASSGKPALAVQYLPTGWYIIEGSIHKHRASALLKMAVTLEERLSHAQKEGGTEKGQPQAVS